MKDNDLFWPPDDLKRSNFPSMVSRTNAFERSIQEDHWWLRFCSFHKYESRGSANYISFLRWKMKDHDPTDGRFPLVAIVAEKDPVSRATLAGILSCDGYRVFQADNLNSAISCLDRIQDTAVLFADLEMPEWKSLVHYALNTAPDLFVIAMAGNNAALDTADLNQCRIDVCFQKPVLYKDVGRVLSENVEGRRAA